eukprot:TRINITY_DN35165_c0_g1_i1.p1 TRINITY_DN35165_c0_g1~~TRINITY_DN35165_c0_g1_i1.p1  ORF type:complete len:453 (+),score=106.69 TRINITY_DN35165_c0_g1_i1:144-1502(+)
MAAKVTKSGYLEKKGGFVPKFKHRFFELKGTELTYKEKPDTEQLGVIKLTKGTKVEAGTKNTITISGTHLRRAYQLQAPDEAEAKSWFSHLTSAVSASTTTPAPPADGGVDVVTLLHEDGGLGLQPGVKVDLNSFELISVIGRGSFGKVMRVAIKGDPERRPLAMKVMRKDVVVREDMVDNTKREKQILQTISHPFIVKLHFAFQTREFLYLVLDLLSGGELFFHLKGTGRFSVRRALLYTAEIVSALTHLHDMDIVYRDLKPENIVLDADGHACLTDFGLAKCDISKSLAQTFCGTPEYLAPEVLRCQPHGRGVDWWSLGCVLYEMLVGLPPFYSENVNEMYDLILKKPLTFPENVPPDARDLIARWLDRDPAKRLIDGAEAKRHPFFKDIDWERLDRKGYEPEFKPAQGTTYVDAEFTSEVAGMSLVQAATKVDEANWTGFTFDPRRQAR